MSYESLFSGLSTTPVTDWLDWGLFEKNSTSGELRLKKTAGALGGLTEDYFKRNDDIIFQGEKDDYVTTDLELGNLLRDDYMALGLNMPHLEGSGWNTELVFDVADYWKVPKGLGGDLLSGAQAAGSTWVGGFGETLWSAGTTPLAWGAEALRTGAETVGADDMANWAEGWRDYYRDSEQDVSTAVSLQGGERSTENDMKEAFYSFNKHDSAAGYAAEGIRDLLYGGARISGQMTAALMGGRLTAGLGGATTAAQASQLARLGTGTVYGSMQFGDTFWDAREHGGGFVESSLAAAVGAVAVGKLEAMSQWKVLKAIEDKRGVLGSIGIEMATEAVQSPAGKLPAVALYDPTVTDDRYSASQMLEDMFDSALGGALGAGGQHAMSSSSKGVGQMLSYVMSAGVEAGSSMNDKQIFDKSLKDMSRAEKTQFNKDLQVFKTLMNANGHADGKLTEDGQKLKADFVKKWGKAHGLLDAIDNYIEDATDGYKNETTDRVKTASRTQTAPEMMQEMEYDIPDIDWTTEDQQQADAAMEEYFQQQTQLADPKAQAKSLIDQALSGQKPALPVAPTTPLIQSLGEEGPNEMELGYPQDFDEIANQTPQPIEDPFAGNPLAAQVVDLETKKPIAGVLKAKAQQKLDEQKAASEFYAQQLQVRIAELEGGMVAEPQIALAHQQANPPVEVYDNESIEYGPASFPNPSIDQGLTPQPTQRPSPSQPISEESRANIEATRAEALQSDLSQIDIPEAEVQNLEEQVKTPINTVSWKTVQITAQAKLEAAEKLLDVVGVVNEEVASKIDDAILELARRGTYERLAPAQRERIQNIYDKLARVSTDEEAQRLAKDSRVMFKAMSENVEYQPGNEAIESFVQAITSVSDTTPVVQAAQTIHTAVSQMKESGGTNLPQAVQEVVSQVRDKLIDRADTAVDTPGQAQTLQHIANLLSTMLPSRAETAPISKHESDAKALDRYATELYKAKESIEREVSLLTAVFTSLNATEENAFGATPEQIRQAAMNLIVGQRNRFQKLLTPTEYKMLVEEVLKPVQPGMKVAIPVDLGKVVERAVNYKMFEISKRLRQTIEYYSSKGQLTEVERILKRKINSTYTKSVRSRVYEAFTRHREIKTELNEVKRKIREIKTIVAPKEYEAAKQRERLIEKWQIVDAKEIAAIRKDEADRARDRESLGLAIMNAFKELGRLPLNTTPEQREVVRAGHEAKIRVAMSVLESPPDGIVNSALLWLRSATPVRTLDLQETLRRQIAEQTQAHIAATQDRGRIHQQIKAMKEAAVQSQDPRLMKEAKALEATMPAKDIAIEKAAELIKDLEYKMLEARRMDGMKWVRPQQNRYGEQYEEKLNPESIVSNLRTSDGGWKARATQKLLDERRDRFIKNAGPTAWGNEMLDEELAQYRMDEALIASEDIPWLEMIYEIDKAIEAGARDSFEVHPDHPLSNVAIASGAIINGILDATEGLQGADKYEALAGFLGAAGVLRYRNKTQKMGGETQEETVYRVLSKEGMLPDSYPPSFAGYKAGLDLGAHKRLALVEFFAPIHHLDQILAGAQEFRRNAQKFGEKFDHQKMWVRTPGQIYAELAKTKQLPANYPTSYSHYLLKVQSRELGKLPQIEAQAGWGRIKGMITRIGSQLPSKPRWDLRNDMRSMRSTDTARTFGAMRTRNMMDKLWSAMANLEMTIKGHEYRISQLESKEYKSLVGETEMEAYQKTLQKEKRDLRDANGELESFQEMLRLLRPKGSNVLNQIEYHDDGTFKKKWEGMGGEAYSPLSYRKMRKDFSQLLAQLQQENRPGYVVGTDRISLNPDDYLQRETRSRVAETLPIETEKTSYTADGRYVGMSPNEEAAERAALKWAAETGEPASVKIRYQAGRDPFIKSRDQWATDAAVAAITPQYQKMKAEREYVLKHFYQTFTKMGVRFNPKINFEALEVVGQDKDKEAALSYLERLYGDMVESVGLQSTPDNIAVTMLNAGASPHDVKTMLNVLGGVASKLSNDLKVPIRTAWNMMAGTIKAVGDGRSAHAATQTPVAGAPAHILLYYDIREGSAEANKVVVLSELLHEIHHSLLHTGVIGEMLNPEERQALSEFLGARVPTLKEAQLGLVQIPFGAHEIFASILERTAFTHEAQGGYLASAMWKIQDSVLQSLHHSRDLANGVLPRISQVSMLGYTPDARVMKIMADLYQSPAPLQWFYTNTNRLLIAAGSDLAQYSREMGNLDITWILATGGQHTLFPSDFNKLREDAQGLKGASLLSKVSRQLAIKNSVFSSRITYGTWLEKVMGFSPDNPPNEIYRSQFNEAYQSYIADMKEMERAGRTRPIWETDIVTAQALVAQWQELPGITADKAEWRKEWEAAGWSPNLGNTNQLDVLESIEPDAAVAKVAAEIRGPMTGWDPSHFNKVVDRFLRLTAPGITPDTTIADPKVSMVRAFHKVWAGIKNPFQTLYTQSWDMQNFLKSHGFTMEWAMLKAMGGTWRQATRVREEGVAVFENGNWIQIAGGLQEVVDEIPEQLREDVIRFWAARRIVEVADHNEVSREEARKAFAQWAQMEEDLAGSGGPMPPPASVTEIEPDQLTAAYMTVRRFEAEHGREAGPIGHYARKLVEWGNKAILDKLEHGGFLSKAEAQELRDKNIWWTLPKSVTEAEPMFDGLFRNTGGTRGALNVLRQVPSSLGNPLDEMYERAMAATVLYNHQFVRNGALRALTTDENGVPLHPSLLDHQTIELLWAKQTPRVVDPQQWSRHDGKKVRKKLANGMVQHVIYESEPLSKETYKTWAKENSAKIDSVFAYWEGGEAKYYLVKDAALKEMLDSINPKELPVALRIIGRLTGAIGSLITMNPQFIAFQLPKDIPNALMRSESGKMNLATLPRDLFEGMRLGLGEYFPLLKKEFPAFYAENTQRNLGLGGQGSFQESLTDGIHKIMLDHHQYKPLGPMASDAERVKNAVKKSIESIVGQVETDVDEAIGKANIWLSKKLGLKSRMPISHDGYLAKSMMFVGVISAELQRATGFMDSVLRLRERQLLREGKVGQRENLRDKTQAGLDKAAMEQMPYTKANQESIPADIFIDIADRQLTLDFSESGEWTRWFAPLKVFARPMFNDTATTTLRLMDKNPARRTAYIMRGVLAYTLPAMINWLRWHDDEEWKKLSPWDKWQYWHLRKNDDGSFKRWPNGIGLAGIIFKDIPLAFLDHAIQKDPLALQKLRRHITDQTPLQFLPPPIQEDFKNWGISVSPTLIEPISEVMANYNQFSGAPIDPYANLPAAEVPSPTERYLDRYGAIEKVMSHALGGQVSPPQVGHIMSKWLPGWGQAAYGGVNEALTAGYNALNPDSQIGQNYNPVSTHLLRMSTQRPFGPASQPVNDLYVLYRNASQTWTDYTQAMNVGADAKAQKIWDSNPDLEYYQLLKNSQSQITQLKIERGRYLKAPGISEEEKRLTVQSTFDVQMTMVAADALRYYTEARNSYPSQNMN